MPVKIRLQRHGKKGKPFYWVVAADVRAPRDGKFLQKIGTYNPNTNPAQIEIDIHSRGVGGSKQHCEGVLSMTYGKNDHKSSL